MRRRPVLHETKVETKTSYCETETETKKGVSRPRWSRDLNIPVSRLFHLGLGEGKLQNQTAQPLSINITDYCHACK